MSTGSGGPDYTPQINASLQQANLPKSPLAQMFQTQVGGQGASLVNNMMNAQNFGNAAFQGFAPAQGGQYPTNPVSTNPNNGNGLFPTMPGVTGGNINPNANQPGLGQQYQFPQLYNQQPNPQIGDANPPQQPPGGFSAGGLNPNDLNPSNTVVYLPGGGARYIPDSNGSTPINNPTNSNNGFNLNVPPPMNPGTAQPLQGIYNNMQFPAIQRALNYGGESFGQLNSQALMGLLGGAGMPQTSFMNPSQGLLQGSLSQNLPQVQNPGTSFENPLNSLLGGMSIPQVQNPFLNFNNPFQGLGNTQQQQVNAQQVNLNDPNAQVLNQIQGANVQAQNPGQINGLGDALQRALSGVGQVPIAQAGQVNIQSPNLSSLSQINPTSGADFQAIQAALNQKMLRDQQNLQASFATGGNSRGTPAAFAQSELMAQQLPQLQQALTAAANANFQNQLGLNSLTQQGLLQNAAQTNQANLDLNSQQLQASLANAQNALSSNSSALNALLPSATTVRGQDITNQQGNAQNLLQQLGLMSGTAQNSGQLGLGLGQLNSGNALQAALANAQNQIGMLNAQGNIAQGAGQLNLGQNQLASGNALQAQQNNAQNLLSLFNNQINAAQGAGQLNLGQNQLASQNALSSQQNNASNLLNLLGLQTQAAGQSGQLNLGQNQLNSQNFLQSLAQQGTNLNNFLGQQNTFLNNQGNYNLGLGSQFNQNQQFNAQQGNQMNLAAAGMNQQAITDQINRAFSGQQNLLGILAGMAAQGVPSGSANVNVGGQTYQGGSGLGSTLSGLGSLIGGLAML